MSSLVYMTKLFCWKVNYQFHLKSFLEARTSICYLNNWCQKHSCLYDLCLYNWCLDNQCLKYWYLYLCCLLNWCLSYWCQNDLYLYNNWCLNNHKWCLYNWCLNQSITRPIFWDKTEKLDLLRLTTRLRNSECQFQEGKLL